MKIHAPRENLDSSQFGSRIPMKFVIKTTFGFQSLEFRIKDLGLAPGTVTKCETTPFLGLGQRSPPLQAAPWQMENPVLAKSALTFGTVHALESTKDKKFEPSGQHLVAMSQAL